MLKRMQVVDLVLFICTLFCTSTLISKYVIIMVYIFQRLSNAVVTTEISLLFDGRSTAVRLLITTIKVTVKYHWPPMTR